MRCWYTRWQMSNALDRGDLASMLGPGLGPGHGPGAGSRLDPGPRRGHLASCASCQAFGRALESLHAELSRGASTAAAPAPRPRARRRLLLAGPVAVGAAAAIMVAIGMRGAPVESPTTPPPQVEVAPSRIPGITGALVRARQVAGRVAQAVIRAPLDAELDDLIHDGKRGIDAVLATTGLR